MATRLTDIKVTASLDATAYISSAQKKVAADEAMSASSEKAGTSIEQTDRKLVSTAGSFNRFIQSNDAAYKATVQYEQGLRRLQQAQSVIADDATYQRQLQLITDKYQVALANAQKYEQSQRAVASSFTDSVNATTSFNQAFDRVAASFAKASEAQAQFNTTASTNNDFTIGVRSYANELERLQALFGPLLGTTLRYKEAVVEVNAAYAAGNINAQQQSQELAVLQSAYDRIIASLTKVSEVQAQVNKTTGVTGGASAETNAQFIEAYSKELDQVQAKFDPIFAAQQKYKQNIEAINNAVAIGAITQAQAGAEISKSQAALTASIQNSANRNSQGFATVVKAQNDVTNATKVSTNAFGLNRIGLIELQASGVNTFQSLAAGIQPLTVLETQAAQVFGAFIQGGLLALRTIITIAAPLAAVGAAIAIVALRISQTNTNLREFNNSLDTVAKSSSTTADSLQEVVKHLRDTGSSAADAKTAVDSLLRAVPQGLNLTGGIGGTADQLLILARNIAAVRGTTFVNEADALTKAVTGNIDGLVKYAQELGVVSGPEANQIELWTKQGERAKAVTLIIQDLASVYDKAFDKSQSKAQEGIQGVITAFNHLVDTLATSGIFDDFLASLTTTVHEIDLIVSGIEKIARAIVPIGAAAATDAARGAQADLAQALRDRGGITEPQIQAVLGNAPQNTATAASLGIGLKSGSSLQRLIASLIQTESGSQGQAAISPTGAIGLTQLEPGTARDLGVNPFNAFENVMGGTRYLLQQIQRFGTVDAGLAAYNAGPGRYQQFLQGRPLPNETVQYKTGVAARADVSGQAGIADLIGGLSANTSDLFIKATDAQTAALGKQTQTIKDQIEVKSQFNAQAAITAARQKAEADIVIQGLIGKQADEYRDKAVAAAERELAVEVEKTSKVATLEAEGADRITVAFEKSTAAGLKQVEVEKARIEALTTGADPQRRAVELLQASAEAAIQGAAQQGEALNRTIGYNADLAKASSISTAALKEQEIQNAASSQTFDVLAKAEAAYTQALEAGTPEQIQRTAADLARATALNEQTKSRLEANAAEVASTQLNISTQQLKDTSQILQAQIGLQGENTDQIQAQVALLQAKQKIEGESVKATQEAKDNYIAATVAIGQVNIALGEARAQQQRFNDEIRSIADTIQSTITTALDNAFAGQQVQKFGDLVRTIFKQIVNTITQTEFVRPLLGSIFGGQLAQQFGTLGSGGGLINGLFGGGGGGGAISGIGGAAALAAGAGAIAVPLTQGGAAVNGVSGGGNSIVANLSSGSSIFSNLSSNLFGAGGLSGFVNNIGGSLGFAVPGAPFSATVAGPSIPGLVSGEGAALPGSIFGTTTLGGALSGIGLGATAGGLLASLTGGNSILGSVGGAAGGLLGGVGGGALLGSIGGPIGSVLGGLIGGLGGSLFGPSKSTLASGNVLSLGTGTIGDVRTSGNAANDQTVSKISSTLADFLRNLTSITGGTVPGSLNVVATTKGINTSYTGPLGNIQATFSSADDAIAQFEQAFLHNVSGISDTLKKVLATITDPSQLQDAVAAAAAYDKAATAFDDLFASVNEGGAKIGPFATILNQLTDRFNNLSASAAKYGLSVQPLQDSFDAAKQRLIVDFNKSITDALAALADPFQAALQNEIDAANQRLADAKAIGADLTNVEKLNQAVLLRAALQASQQLGAIGQDLDGFVTTLGNSLGTLFTNVEAQVNNLFTSGAGVQQLSGTDAFSQAYNSIQQQSAAALKAVAASPPADKGVYDALIASISGVTEAALKRLATDFSAGIADLSTAATNPLQEAVTKEVIAGKQRIAVAQAVGADLTQIEKYNQENLLRVAAAAQQAIGSIVTAEDAIKGAGDTLSQAISSVVQVDTTTPFAAALKNLNTVFGALIKQVDTLSNSTADVTPILKAYADQIDKLRGTFNDQIAQLTLAITDPVQAAINTELEAGKKRVADAMAIGADLVAVDKFNALNLVKVFEGTQGAVNGAVASIADLNTAISSVVPNIKGPFAQAFDALNAVFATLDKSTAAVTAYQTALSSLRDTFNTQIAELTLGLTDPVQAALNVELKAGKDRVAEAKAIGADLAAVDRFNALNLKKVFDATQSASGAVLDFVSSLATLKSTLNQLKGGTLSGLTPVQDLNKQLTDFRAQLKTVLASPTTENVAALAQSGGGIVQFSQQLYGNAPQTRNIRKEITDALDSVGVLLNKLQSDTSKGGVDLTNTLKDQIKAGNSIADKLDAIALDEFKRTGIHDTVLEQESSDIRKTVADWKSQLKSGASITQIQIDRNKLSLALYQQELDIGNRILDSLNSRADATKQGTADTIASNKDIRTQYQSQLDASKSYASSLHQIADAEFKRTGVHDTFLEKEAADADTAVANMQATLDSGQAISQTELDRSKLSTAQLGQEVDVGTRKLNALNAGASVTEAQTGIVKSGYDLALEQLDIQRKLAEDVTALTKGTLDSLVRIANEIIASQQAAADAYAQAVKFYQGLLNTAQTATPTPGAPPPPPAEAAPPSTPPQVPPDWHAYKIHAPPGFLGEFFITADTASVWSSLGAKVNVLGPIGYGNLLDATVSVTRDAYTNVGGTGAQAASWAAGGADVTLVAYQRGTDSARAGYALVGEQGPEVIRLRGGEQIYPNGSFSQTLPSNDNSAMVELRALREEVAALRKQMQGGQIQANKDARAIQGETATVGRKIVVALPTPRRVVA